ncbi:hypothetical protein PC9H_002396 [Pleurotus ostreatus]|uniref:Uncharacterized protein n=2 Tax=Pleurotus ostreatus TaxID=5322 RepID=A0A067N454_PLEO1|nr:uncharacterized protein PC9H_002396 [Pleurotus ostreatus]KAF7416135.1 hypothetical protein PC9H_002396 [Pleurotus ostreatus]KDQ22644.1 hypothetical protein PLEOSDRAFT_171967 [Pleurotus ostreatus PC15]
MPLNETLTNTSPRLQYSPPSAWSDALLDDPLLDEYYTRSYRATNSSAGKGTVSFTWKGASIWIYGGYRERLGPYQIALDGEVETFPGYIQGSTPHGNILLFGRRDLDESQMHTFELTNLGENGQVLDLDYIVLEHQAFVPEESPSSFLNKRSEGHATKTPLIAGVSVISVLVLVMVCMVVWWRRQKNSPKEAAKDRQLIPDPYLCSPDMLFQLQPVITWRRLTPSLAPVLIQAPGEKSRKQPFIAHSRPRAVLTASFHDIAVPTSCKSPPTPRSSP